MRRNITDWEQTIADLQSLMLKQSLSPAAGTLNSPFKLCRAKMSDVIGTNIYRSLANLVGTTSSI